MLAAFFAFGMLFTLFYLIALFSCLVWSSRRKRAREDASRMAARLRKMGDKVTRINYSLVVHVWNDPTESQNEEEEDIIINNNNNNNSVDVEQGYSSCSSNSGNLVDGCDITVERLAEQHGGGYHSSIPGSTIHNSLSNEHIVVQQQDDSDDDNDDEHGRVCAICLVEFQTGDIYGQSSNPTCRHIFHQDCIVGWLLTRDDGTCPCCRQPYLFAHSTSSSSSDA